MRAAPALALTCTVLLGCGADQADDARDAPPAPNVPKTAARAPAQGPAVDSLFTDPVEPAGSGPFDSARAWEDLRRQVALGPRPAGSAALEACRRYIIDQLQAARIGTRQQAFIAETPAGQVPMINVIATIPGRRDARIILASHIDTKRAPFRFVGANDGASSTAALLEIGRVLSGTTPEYTIELLFLDGEEAVNWDWGTTGVDNTYGSRHYVEQARRAQTLDDIAALVLLDMIGEPTPRILRDGNSTPWLADIIWTAADRLGYGSAFVDEVTRVEDDHVPFVRAGVPAVDIIDIEYPQWHTAEDDLAHVSADSLKLVGDVVLAALPAIQQYAAATPRAR